MFTSRQESPGKNRTSSPSFTPGFAFSYHSQGSDRRCDSTYAGTTLDVPCGTPGRRQRSSVDEDQNLPSHQRTPLRGSRQPSTHGTPSDDGESHPRLLPSPPHWGSREPRNSDDVRVEVTHRCSLTQGWPGVVTRSGTHPPDPECRNTFPGCLEPPDPQETIIPEYLQ